MVLVNFFYEKNSCLVLKKKEIRFWLKKVVKEENKELKYRNGELKELIKQQNRYVEDFPKSQLEEKYHA